VASATQDATSEPIVSCCRTVSVFESLPRRFDGTLGAGLLASRCSARWRGSSARPDTWPGGHRASRADSGGWVDHYSHRRPHTALGRMAPMEFTATNVSGNHT